MPWTTLRALPTPGIERLKTKSGVGTTLALTQIRTNPESRAYYQRKRFEGKPHWVALTALARQLCKAVFKMMTQEELMHAHTP